MIRQTDTAGTALDPTNQEEPFSRPPPLKPDDLVILARDDIFYWLPKCAYQNETHQLATSMDSQARLLMKQGVVLAEIPQGSIPGVGGMCFLVNLSALPRTPKGPPSNPTQRPPSADTPTLDPDDLLIADGHQQLYWVKKDDYQDKMWRLDTHDPILEEQVRLLTNQGVVIADIPGNTLPGVENMGCLVNLRAIQRPDDKQQPPDDTHKQQSTPQASGVPTAAAERTSP